MKKHTDKFKYEIDAKDVVITQQSQKIAHLLEEVLIAKRILKDTKLNTAANKRYQGSIDTEDPTKFMVGNSILTDIMEAQGEDNKMFEVENLAPENNKSLI